MNHIDELWHSKESRDARYKELRAQGHHPRRYSIRNQQLRIEYVEDLKGTLAGQSSGFGNTVYQTFFAVLYGVQVRGIL